MTPITWRSSAVQIGASLAVAVLSLGVGMLVVAAAGFSPAATASALWRGAFVGSQSLDGTLKASVPLVLAGLAWVVAFRAGQINVGLEGQMLAGGTAATMIGLQIGGLPTAAHLSLAVVAGVGGGAAWAALAALLWARRGVNEIVATFMLNLVALLAVLWLINGPLQEPSRSLPMSDTIAASASWPAIPGHPSLYWDIAYVPIMVAIIALVLRRTTAGFKLRLTGANPEAARQAGVSVVKVGALALVASGAIAGLAGSSLILASPAGSMQEGFSSNLGYEGIAIALLARNSPLGCVPAALLFGALRNGAGLAEAEVGVNTSLIDLTFGLLIIVAATAHQLADWRKRLPLARAGRAATR